jgi:hypothetical protein
MQNGGALKCVPGRSQKFDVGAGSREGRPRLSASLGDVAWSHK